MVVLGMHRSGTSLLSNILHLLGVDMVEGTPHASGANPTGFWERQDIVSLQDDILSVIERPIGKPSHVLPFPAVSWRDPQLWGLKARLRELVQIQLESTPGPWGFKDPRTCRLLPLWAELFGELGITPRYVWAIRHPLEAASSMTLKSRWTRPMTVSQSEVLWLVYNYDIARYTLPGEPLIVDYNQWFDAPLATAQHLAAALGIPLYGAAQDLDAAISSLVTREHRHHWHLDQPEASKRLSEVVYESLLAARSGGSNAKLNALLPSIRWSLEVSEPFITLADKVASITAQNERIAAKLERRTKALVAQRAERQTLTAQLRELRYPLREKTGSAADTTHAAEPEQM